MNPNDPINRVLTNLGNTPTPTGLEHRVLQGIHTRTSNLKPRTWIETLQSLAAAPWLSAGLALCATAALALFLFTHAPHAEGTHPQTAAANADLPTLTTLPQQTAISTAPSKRSRRSPYQPGATPREHTIGITPPTPEDTLALSETRAPSLPPPTLPLTADERRMQAAVRHGELPQLAELHIPDPPPTSIAPIFAGFLTRPEEDAPPADSDTTAAPDNAEITTGDTQ